MFLYICLSETEFKPPKKVPHSRNKVLKITGHIGHFMTSNTKGLVLVH